MFLNINTKLCTQCFFTTGHNKIGGLLRRVNGEITAKIHHWISTLKIGESIQRRQLALQCLTVQSEIIPSQMIRLVFERLSSQNKREVHLFNFIILFLPQLTPIIRL